MNPEKADFLAEAYASMMEITDSAILNDFFPRDIAMSFSLIQ